MDHPIAFRFQTPESSNGFLLWKVTHKWQSGIQKLLLPHNLTHPQFVVLAVLAWYLQVQKTVPTQVQIAHHAQIDPMTVSVIIRSLLKKGLIQRTPHATDSRAYAIRLTGQ